MPKTLDECLTDTHFYKTLRGQALHWLKLNRHTHPPEDMIHNAFLAALEHPQSKPDDVSWEKHLLFLMICPIRDLSSGPHYTHVELNPDHEYGYVTDMDEIMDEERERLADRDETVRMILNQLRDEHRAILLDMYVHRKKIKTLTAKYKVARSTLYWRLAKAVQAFRLLAGQFEGYSPFSLDQPLLVTDTTFSPKSPNRTTRPYESHTVACPTDQFVFYDTHGERVEVSQQDQAQVLKERCARQRETHRKTHSPDASYATDSQSQTDLQF